MKEKKPVGRVDADIHEILDRVAEHEGLSGKGSAVRYIIEHYTKLPAWVTAEAKLERST